VQKGLFGWWRDRQLYVAQLLGVQLLPGKLKVLSCYDVGAHTCLDCHMHSPKRPLFWLHS
jgi:hypothetical protein